MRKRKEARPTHHRCPFCGGDSTSVLRLPSNEIYWVQCDVCHAQGPRADSHEQAVKRWNIDLTSPWVEVA